MKSIFIHKDKFIEYLNKNKSKTTVIYYWLSIFTSAFIFLICNLIVQNKNVLLNSLIIELISLVLITLYFSILYLTKNKELGLYLIIIIILSGIFINPNIALILITVISFISLKLIIKNSNVIDVKNSAKYALVTALLLITLYNITSPQPFTQYISIINGVGSTDTLYHASISAMIKNHQTISTGLHGIIKTPYHSLSHSIFAGLSSISGMTIIETIEFSKWLLLVPLLIFSICSFCEKIYIQGESNKKWLITVVILVSFPLLLSSWNFWNNYFNSDSYLLSLILLMIGIERLIKKKLNGYDYIYIFLTLILMSFSKGSTGALYLILITVRLLMTEISNKKRIIIFLNLILIILIFFIYYINSIKNIKFDYFNFIIDYSTFKNYSYLAEKNYILNIIIFYVMHFLISIVSIIYIYKKNTYNYYYKLIIIISYLIGCISVAFLNIPGGSVYYISNIAFFVAMPILITELIQYLEIDKNKYYIILLIFSILLIKDQQEWNKNKVYLLNLNTNRNFINTLIEIRNNTKTNTIIIANKNYIKENITIFKDWKCKPYIFTAVTERPWINVFYSWNDCNYLYYSFGFYGLSPKNNIPTIEFVAPKNATFFFWPNK
jgi:hypothetical protein